MSKELQLFRKDRLVLFKDHLSFDVSSHILYVLYTAGPIPAVFSLITKLSVLGMQLLYSFVFTVSHVSFNCMKAIAEGFRYHKNIPVDYMQQALMHNPNVEKNDDIENM